MRLVPVKGLCQQRKLLLLFYRQVGKANEFSLDKWMPEERKLHKNADTIYIREPAKPDSGKFYALSMFPYPSGSLHMGHVRVYVVSDVLARYQRMLGKNVIHPIGWDAFGLPAENAAIENSINPQEWTLENIELMKGQIDSMGCQFDWDREISTCDPDYYRWTQSLFLKLFHAGLIYQCHGPVNWDPVDQTVLANEQVDEDGRGWRSGAQVQKKLMKQWYVKTSKYAESLYRGLDNLDCDQWKEVIAIQKNWIGESNGYVMDLGISIALQKEKFSFKIFLDRPELVHGISHCLISPRNHLLTLPRLKSLIHSHDIELEAELINPFTGNYIPIFIDSKRKFSDDDMCHVGVPSRSEEDREFAERRKILFDEVIDDAGNLKNSGMLTGLSPDEARCRFVEYAQSHHVESYRTSFNLKDWLISRQRYWGTPIPIVHCPKYGAVPVDEKDLPVILPHLDVSKLKKAFPLKSAPSEWLNVKCSRCDCNHHGIRETDTMDTFMDSSWYFLRYLDPGNSKLAFRADVVRETMPVDMYIGGKEHATLHLFYARFISHFLHDEGLVFTREPFKDFVALGIIKSLAFQHPSSGNFLKPSQLKFSGGEVFDRSTGVKMRHVWSKMSKSKFNGLNPQVVLDSYGVETTRICVCSQAAPRSEFNWSDERFKGTIRWQGRIWGLVHDYVAGAGKKVAGRQATEDELFKARNATLMRLRVELETSVGLHLVITKLQGLTHLMMKCRHLADARSLVYEQALADILVVLSIFAPAFCSTLWEKLRKVGLHPDYSWDEGLLEQRWPKVSVNFHQDIPIMIDDKVSDIAVVCPYPYGSESKLSKQEFWEILEDNREFKKLKKTPEHIKIKFYDAMPCIAKISMKKPKDMGEQAGSGEWEPEANEAARTSAVQAKVTQKKRRKQKVSH